MFVYWVFDHLGILKSAELKHICHLPEPCLQRNLTSGIKLFIYNPLKIISGRHWRKNKIIKCHVTMQYISRSDVQRDYTDHWGTANNRWMKNFLQWGNTYFFIFTFYQVWLPNRNDWLLCIRIILHILLTWAFSVNNRERLVSWWFNFTFLLTFFKMEIISSFWLWLYILAVEVI